MSLRELDINCFSAALSSKAPFPGGGGASALCGALAADLGSMVGELTAGKKAYADVEEDIKALTAKAAQLSEELKKCIDEDAEAFAPLSRAYSMPKDDPGRDEMMEMCLRQAAYVPLKIFDLCVEVIDLQQQFAVKGSRMVLSDAATGAALARGALMGAAMNVKVNTAAMKDREYASRTDAHIDAKLGEYKDKADMIFAMVCGRYE